MPMEELDAEPTDFSESRATQSGIVCIALADGTAVEASASLLASHSSVFNALLSSGAAWKEASHAQNRWTISLPEHDPRTIRLTLAWMAADEGRAKREAAEALVAADVVVSCARLAHYLELAPLLGAAIAQISAAVDSANAPSILLLARELSLPTLEERASLFIVSQLDQVEADSEEFWAELPQLTRDTLAMIRAATLRNPLLSAHGLDPGCATPNATSTRLGDSTSSDLRELLSMVRESLAEMRDRFEQARQRQAEEIRHRHHGSSDAVMAAAGYQRSFDLTRTLEHLRLDMYGPALTALGYGAEDLCTRTPDELAVIAERCGMPRRSGERFSREWREAFAASSGGSINAANQSTLRTLDKQAAKILNLEQYLAKEMANFTMLLARSNAPPAPPSIATPPTQQKRKFEPSYEWAEIDDDWFLVPAGLEVDLPLDGVNKRRARIPPRWQLRVWLDETLGYFRTEVTRDKTLGQLRESAAAFAEVNCHNLRWRFRGDAAGPTSLADDETVESSRLFERRNELVAVITGGSARARTELLVDRDVDVVDGHASSSEEDEGVDAVPCATNV